MTAETAETVTPALPLDQRPGEGLYLNGRDFSDEGPGGLSYRRLKAYYSRQPTPTLDEAASYWNTTPGTIRKALERWPDLHRPARGRRRDYDSAAKQARIRRYKQAQAEGPPADFLAFMSRVPTPSVQDAMNHFGWSRYRVKKLLADHPTVPRRVQGGEGQIERQPAGRIEKPDLLEVMSRVPTPSIAEAARLLGTNRHVVSWGLKQWPEIPRITRNTGEQPSEAVRKRRIREQYLERMIRFRYRCRMRRLDPVLVLSEYLRRWLNANPSPDPRMEQLFLDSVDELREDIHDAG